MLLSGKEKQRIWKAGQLLGMVLCLGWDFVYTKIKVFFCTSLWYEIKVFFCKWYSDPCYFHWLGGCIECFFLGFLHMVVCFLSGGNLSNVCEWYSFSKKNICNLWNVFELSWRKARSSQKIEKLILCLSIFLKKKIAKLIALAKILSSPPPSPLVANGYFSCPQMIISKRNLDKYP